MLTTDQVLGKGRYRIISNFAQDGTGGLYEAYDTVSNSNVVLKESVGSGGRLMTATQLDEMNNAFAGKAKALTEVRHESLLSVQNYFSEIDRQYLVMESVDGCDLTRFLDPNEKAPAITDVLNWADQILDALHYLHTLPRPMIHRDVRPANIRLTSSFKVKLLTAGIGPDGSDVIMASADNPADSVLLNYRPLEQLWGGLDAASQKVIANSYDDQSRKTLDEPLDARSDVYSVGATLYHVLSRTLPKDALERSIEILDGNADPLVPLSELESSVPQEVSRIIMKSLELKREDRFSSADEMRRGLARCLDNLKDKKTSTPQPRLAPEPLSKTEPVSETKDSIEEEARRVEQRRLELEAAQRQLEEEQQRIEQKRRELEAEQERKRAEQKQLDLEAEIQRQREKTERLKAAEKKQAEARAASAGDVGDDEQFLLEVEPVTPASDDFEWSVDVSEEPVRRHSTKPDRADSDNVEFNIEAAPRSNIKVMVAGAGVLVLALAVVGWLFLGGPSHQNAPEAQVPSSETAAPQQELQQPVSSFSEANTSRTDDTTAVQNSRSDTTTTADSQTENPSAQAKPKKAATPAKTTEKKKVTVDDLINDN
jgi:serine/threonine protein kinase